MVGRTDASGGEVDLAVEVVAIETMVVIDTDHAPERDALGIAVSLETEGDVPVAEAVVVDSRTEVPFSLC